MQGIIPLKPSMDDQVLSWVAQGGELAKVPKTVRSCPFKASRPPKEGWPQDDSSHFDLSDLDQLWELGPRRPPNQHEANLALRPCGPDLGVEPWLAPVRLRLESKV
jgi:hypothetical protein